VTERTVVLYCPYCGEEELVPEEEPAGAWRCESCQRAFAVRFIGLHTLEVSGQ